MATTFGTAGPDSLTGTDGNDSLYGLAGNDWLDGGAGDDHLNAGWGSDTLYGGDGNDVLGVPDDAFGDFMDGGNGNDTLIASEGLDTLFGGTGDDELYGKGGMDSLDGGDGNDSIHGGAGNDTLIGGQGLDTLRGGLGNDAYYINDLTDTIVEDLDGGDDTAVVSISGFKASPNIEHVIYTNDALPLAYWVDALIAGYYWATPGTATTLTFGFLTDETNPALRPYPTFQPFSATDQAATVKALNLWAQTTNLNFVLAPDVSQAQVRFGFADLTGIGAGTGGYPNPTGHSDVTADKYFVGGEITYLASAFRVVAHEIGHASGLKHPGDYNGAPPFLGQEEDTRTNSVMSYRDTYEGRNQVALGPFDIAAAQYLYGANPNLNGGDTIYRYSQLAWPNSLIGDGRGIDTLDASDVAPTPDGSGPDMTIDLRPGSRIFAGAAQALISSAGQASINYNTVIENAVGSSGRDSIFGNEADNVLSGGAGDDTLYGAQGNDTLVGDAGADQLNGGKGNDLLSGGEGNDNFTLSDGLDSLFGGAGDDEMRAPLARSAYSLSEVQPGSGMWRLQALADAAQASQLVGIERIVFADGTVALATGLNSQSLSGAALSFTLDEDTPLGVTLDVPAHSSQTLIQSRLGTAPLRGQVVVAANGHLSYVPNADFSGQDSLTVLQFDEAGHTLERTVSLTITPVNDAPQGKELLVMTASPEVLVFTLHARDAEGDALTFQMQLQPAHGSAVLRPDGQIEYLPQLGYMGADLLLVRVTDSHGGASTIVVNLVSTGDRLPPFEGTADVIAGSAFDERLESTASDNTLIGGAGSDTLSGSAGADLLQGGPGDDTLYDFDGGADTLLGGEGDDDLNVAALDTAADLLDGGAGNDNLFGGPGNDTLIGGPGNDTLSGRLGNDTLIDLEGVNAMYAWAGDDTLIIAAQAPAIDGLRSVSGAEGTDTLILRLGADSSLSLAEADAISQLRSDPTATRNYTALHLLVSDIERVELQDMQGLALANFAPFAANLAAMLNEDTSLAGNLPAAADIEGSAITYAKASGPAHGTLAVNANGSFNYTPAPNFQGEDRFTYAVRDAQGLANVYAVSLTVVAVVDTISGSAGRDSLSGFADADVLRGLVGDDQLAGLGGSDTLDGGAGIDTAVYACTRFAASLAPNGSGWTVVAPTEGTDLLTGIERLQFSDTALALDLAGNAGWTARILGAVFGRPYVANKAVVGIGLHLLDDGMPYADLVALAVSTDLFKQLAGAGSGPVSNTQFVNLVYKNVVGTLPGASDLAYFVGQLDDHRYTQATLAQLACDLELTATAIDLVGLTRNGIEFDLPPGE